MNSTNGSRTSVEAVKSTYQKMEKNLALARRRLKRPLTLAEKIIYGHLREPQPQSFERGGQYLHLQPDRVAMHDISGQMAVLQFMMAEKEESAVPTTIHCDHLIQAQYGAEMDIRFASQANEEIYRFLESSSHRYGIGFWKPGSGIIHQVVLENYAFPGGLIIGTDSHTSNAGGLGTIGSGVGGADAADVMAGLPWEVKNPKLIGVHLKGRMNGWTSAKDVILKLLGMLTTKGGTDRIIEYFGEGATSISCTGKATITNMGAELGATSSVFPFDGRMAAYLQTTGREDIANLANQYLHLLLADEEVLETPKRFFDEVYEIDLSNLEPQVVGPHSPDTVRPISEVAREAKEKGWKIQLSSALIGSCTNSSYQDIGRAAHIANQAKAMGLKMPQPFYVSPGSNRIQDTIVRDGYIKTLKAVGATVLASACGPCIGQWNRPQQRAGDKNTIITSFNRNFRGRNDSNSETMAFIASPEIVTAIGIAGRLDFNPVTDTIDTPYGPRKFLPPQAPELPENGFSTKVEGFQEPVRNSAQVQIDPKSERLHVLTPFPKWELGDLHNLLILGKIQGKCTTDHISPAGPWLQFRGHLPNISANFLQRASNAFSREIGRGTNLLTGAANEELSQIAKSYSSKGRDWILVADENYGEGSSREQAAMTPRYLGCRAIIAKSFARIHETNLKKQGVLALTFQDPRDWQKIQSDDLVNLVGIEKLSPNSTLCLDIRHKDGTSEAIVLRHSYNFEQVLWFKAGSALNYVRQNKMQA